MHASSAANINFFLPEDEPSRYLFHLYPYLASAEATSIDPDLIFILLEISNALLIHLSHHLTENHVSELRMKFFGLMTRTTQTKLIISSCKCLCTLANRLPSVGSFLCKIVVKYRQYIQQHSLDTTSHRLLFLLGHICMNCPNLLEENNKVGLKIYLDLFLHLFNSAVNGKSAESNIKVLKEVF